MATVFCLLGVLFLFIFQQVLDEFPGQHDLNYSSWMFYSVPLASDRNHPGALVYLKYLQYL